MPVQYGKVVSFNPLTGWGFAKIDGTEESVFVHKQRRCEVIWIGSGVNERLWQPSVPCSPEPHDALVFETRQQRENKRPFAIAWAFKREWDSARPETPIPAAPSARSQPPKPVPTPDPVPAVPLADPPLTFGEMLKVFDYRFLHALLDAMEKKELTIAQLQNFVSNPPKGKRGEALWEAFHKRKSNSRNSKKYGVAAYIKQTLEEAGFLVEL